MKALSRKVAWALVALITVYPGMAMNHSIAQEDKEITCLAQNAYHEARGQHEVGMLGVTFVVINRMKSKRFPNSACEVVWQKRLNRAGNWIPQFSWTLDGKSDEITHFSSWSKALELASDAYHERVVSPVGQADHYHRKDITKWWSKKMAIVAEIGDHLFFDSRRQRTSS